MAKNPLARRRIRIAAPVLLATVVALLLVWMVSTVSASFAPISTLTLSSHVAGENTDITSIFSIPKDDVNFESTIEFTPPQWFVASDDDVDDGTVVGTLTAQATLGIALGAQDTCAVSLPPSFTLYDATTKGDCTPDTGDQVGGTWDGYNKVCTGQGSEERAICEYPCFLDQLFPVRPLARYYGHWQGSGLGAALNFVIFPAGTALPGGPSAQTEAWGYPSVTVLNNTGAAWGASAPSALADFCTPLSTNNKVNAEADGIPLRTNPNCSDTFTFRSWANGQPDADGDGLENGLDSCPFQVGTYNPRNGGTLGDADSDGLDDVCDPTPNTSNADEDGDGYDNAADNCPTVANGVAQAPNNQTDTDGDSIGDACDTVGAGGIGLGPNTVDGSKPEVLNTNDIEITGGEPCSAGGGTGTATPTPTGTATATGTATPTGTAVEGTATPTATTVAGEGCAPVIPGTYNGLVRLNGVPAPAGYEVTASIDGTEWGSTIVSGGRYALDVPQKLPSAEPCFAGGTITFTIDGGVCEPTEDWASGLHDVDLSCAPAATPTVVPPSTPVVTPPPTTPVVTPAKPPTTGAGGLGGDQGLPLWAMLLAAWGGLTALAGLGTVATRIVKR